MDQISRRTLLALGAVGSGMFAATAQAATFGNPDQPAEGAVNVDPAVMAKFPNDRPGILPR